jgi:hypothetical protein
LRSLFATAAIAAAALAAAAALPAGAAAAGASRGELDCNGFSPIQGAVKPTMACADIRGVPGDGEYSSNGRFYDNGHYVGHDEPDMTFLSNRHGSGNDVTWVERLPRDPATDPTVTHPGGDVAHWFELSIAPWFSMDLCNPKSYPLTPCTPESDANAPHGDFPGGGSAFLEAQFYPPGFGPFVDGISCDNAHWCASLHINDLECTNGFGECNDNCVEPTNFAFVQTDGVPTGPPSPQEADLSTFTPNRHTLLMNPGDVLVVHIFNAPVPGHRGQRALMLTIRDLSTGQSGFMQASAANGYQATSIVDCSGTPWNYEPAYDTAKRANIAPWTALQTNISTQYEIGHFEGCTSITDPVTLDVGSGVTDTVWLNCHGPYEDAAGSPDAGNGEQADAPCYPKGDTHGALHSDPDKVTGCAVFLAGNDVDFDGSSYWPEWPVGPAPTRLFPGSFLQAPPTSDGHRYAKYFVQTDVALSEPTCAGPTTAGCAVPPPNAPGGFYPYFSRVGSGAACLIEFGNVSSGPGVDDLGKDDQYGTDQRAVLGYDEFIGPTRPNACTGG